MLFMQARISARKLLLCQFVAAVIAAVAFGVFQEQLAAVAAVSGGAICVLGNAYFSRKAFSVGGAQAAKQIVRAFYIAQMGKIGITVVLFLLALWLGKLPIFPLFIGYVAALLAFWSAPWIFRNTKVGVSHEQ
jgi:ATP synthase protein I